MVGTGIAVDGLSDAAAQTKTRSAQICLRGPHTFSANLIRMVQKLDTSCAGSG